jgi:hypothetical protein
MARQYWGAPLPPLHVVDGASYNTSVTLTDVSAAPQKQLAAMQLELGTELELNASGFFSNTVTPTLLLGFYYGGVAGTALAASSAVATASGVTGVPWTLYYRGRVRTVGASGSIVGQGVLQLGTSLTAFTTRPIPETLAARTVTIDTTIVKTITVGAQWGTSSASNTLTCNDLSVVLYS